MNVFLNALFNRYPALAVLETDIGQAFTMIRDCYINDGTLFVCGNGGSAADCEHIVGELMKGFIKRRPVGDDVRNRLIESCGEEGKYMAGRLQCGLRAVSLTGHPALSTAYGNDVDGSMVFAQQIFVLGRPGDCLLGISTSGNSDNVVKCLRMAKSMGIGTIAMTACGGGKCAEIADCRIKVPEKETYLAQEYHLPIYHCLCMMLEDHFYGE